ncbi:hypothetical protein Tco_0836532 [Tanacetum coccineum]
MDNSKRGYIPMQERLDLNKTQGASTPKEVKRMQNVPYALVMSSIMYAVRCTRPDVVFAQNITSRFQQNHGEYIAASEAAIEAVWIRKFISGLGEIKLLKVHTDDNLADPFMKALPKGKLTQQARSMGLRLASSFI